MPNTVIETVAEEAKWPLAELEAFLDKWEDDISDADGCMISAAFDGHEVLVRVFKDRGATSYAGALIGAATNGHTNIMVLLKEWALEFDENVLNEALLGSSVEWNEDAMRLLKEWGATDFESAKENIECSGIMSVDGDTSLGRKLLLLCDEWIAERDEEMAELEDIE